jgi:hypothetical protein
MLAYAGLATQYTIAGQGHSAYRFLYDLELPPTQWQEATPPPNQLALNAADQFTLPWTTQPEVYGDSKDLAQVFASWLTEEGTDAATDNFWRTIADFGLPYNLLILERVDQKQSAKVAAEFGDAWAAEEMDAAVSAGRAYMIDMTIFEPLPPFHKATFEPMPPFRRSEETRFTPGTLTVLKQDPTSKELTPTMIKVSTEGGPAYTYTKKNRAWLYALQAAKASITVWGIWLGHVYHWHIVTAAMQMTMFDKLPQDHPARQLLEPQSQSLIDFDFVLLTTLWNRIAPPTPVSGFMPLLKLLDRFAQNRTLLDDDPLKELEKRGITQADFTTDPKTPWDAYPVAGHLVKIYAITREYVHVVVGASYKTDDDVKHDKQLQEWLTASRDPFGGNVRVGDVESVEALTNVLTSLLYRVTVHGAGSITPAVNPTLAFVANFPPCLVGADIPAPDEEVDVLGRLPHTGTIGGMTTFYFTFVYTQPYQPLIPSGGITEDPYFPGPPEDPRNQALFRYRGCIHDFIDEYVIAWNQALARLGRRDPAIPGYAKNQYQQWARSIEI